jgi:hypothetical protein
VEIDDQSIFRGNDASTNKSKNIRVSATRIKQRISRRRLRNVVKNYICGKSCAYAAGSNNITGYLVVITEVERVKTKALLDSEYIKNYINLK